MNLPPHRRRGEIQRRMIHLSLALLPILYAGWLERPAMLGVLGAMVLASAVVELVRRGRGTATRLFEAVFGRAIRPEERRGLLGSTHYSLGAMATVLIFPREAAAPALLILALADPAASTVGRRLGRIRIGSKSLEGTLAFWLAASAGVAALWAWRPELALGAMLVAAPVAAVTELLTPGRLDNWTIPLLAAAVIYMCG